MIIHTKLKRLLSCLLAAAIISSAGISALAADVTYSVTNAEQGVTVSTQDSNFSAASSLDVSVHNAADGLPDYAYDSNAKPALSRMWGSNGFAAELTPKDAQSTNLAYSGTVTVSFDLPEDWDLAHGVAVYRVYEAELAGTDGTLLSYAASEITDKTLTNGQVTFDMEFDTATENAKSYRLLIMQDVYSADLSGLTDGVYNVGLTMLKNVDSMSLSMASNTMDFDAQYIVSGDKRYLKITFNPGIVIYNPAFCNKIYAVNAQDTTIQTPGITLSYHDTEEVRQFSYETMQLTGSIMGYTDEDVWAMVDTNILQNGLKYIHEAVIDVTDSLQENGCYLVGFCSDIMDSLYSGAYGSDTGYNTTNLMISDPVKNDTLSPSDIVPAAAVDKSALTPIFEKYLSLAGITNNTIKSIYTEDSYNTYYVPAWVSLYQAYTYVGTTQEEIDAHVNDLAILDNLVYVKDSEAKYHAKSLKLKSLLKKANKITDGSAYTSASYTAMVDARTAAQAVYDDADALKVDVLEQYDLLTAAYDGLALKATDYSALQAAVDAAKALDLTGYTSASVRALQEEIANAEAMITAQDSSDAELAAEITALQSATDALSTVAVFDIPDGTYSISGEMVQTDRSGPSMADKAINSVIKLTVEDGVATVHLDFGGIQISNMFGYLGALSYFNGDYTYDDYGYPQGNVTAAAVETTQKDAQGNDIIDSYNDAEHLYPDQISFPLVTTDSYVPLQVYVPIMESISEGSGIQTVYLRLDWDTLTEAGESEAKAAEVDALIAALGEMTSSAQKSAVEAARAAYDALTDTQKAWVTQVDVLTAAEQKVTDFVLSDEVIAQIAALGDILSLDQQQAVASARSAYDALTDTQKTLVTNLDTLTAAEDAISELAVVLGDLTGDGLVTVADVVELRDIIMKGNPSESDLQAGDLDDSGSLTVSDVVALRDYIMKGGSAS